MNPILSLKEMMKTFSLIPASLSIILLMGCASPQLLAATANSVTYKYDNNFISSKFVAQTASAHCAKYGKKAELSSSTISLEDKSHTDIFECR